MFIKTDCINILSLNIIHIPHRSRNLVKDCIWFGRIGVGKPSPVVNTRTKGVEPTVPDARRFLEVSAGTWSAQQLLPQKVKRPAVLSQI